MKTGAIKQQILSNYKQLSQLAQEPATNKNVVSAWGVNYKQKNTRGFINQMGLIERNRSSIQIVNGNELKLNKKPFYMTWKRALKNINNMLQDGIANFNNKEVVHKRVVSLVCFTKEAANKLSKIAKR